MIKYVGGAIKTVTRLYWISICGYSNDFDLRLCMAGFAASWPLLLGGHTLWTVGLVATLISFSSIIAADTFAFVGGKVLFLS